MTPEVPGPPWRTTVGEGGLLPSLPSLQKVSGWSAIGRAVGCPPIPLSGPQETDLEGTASQCLLLHPGLQGGLTAHHVASFWASLGSFTGSQSLCPRESPVRGGGSEKPPPLPRFSAEQTGDTERALRTQVPEL